MLLLLLMVGLLCACSQAPSRSAYRVQIPVLRAVPLELACEEPVDPKRCVIVLRRDDYRALVRELKAACLGTGQTPQECQATE